MGSSAGEFLGKGTALKCVGKAGAAKAKQGSPQPLPCSRWGVRDRGCVPGRAPRWLGGDLGGTGGLAGAAKTLPVALR